MKTITRPISILLSVLMLMSVLTAAPFTVSAAEVVKSGIAGHLCIWELDDEGKLTISGTGAMWNFDNIYPRAPWYDDKEKIKTVVIEWGVTNIGDYAFYKCTSLTSVTISKSVESIGERAFFGCYGIKSIAIPQSVKSINETAFDYCNDDLIIQGEVYSCASQYAISNGISFSASTDFCRWMLDGEGKLTISGHGTMPNYDYHHGNPAPWYVDREKIKTVVIGDGITSIGNDAFINCKNLTNVRIPNSVTRIGRWAFGICESLPSVEIPESVRKIDVSAFCCCDSLISVTIPFGVKSIGESTFSCCHKLESVIVYADNTIFDDQAFLLCPNLKTVTVFGEVKSIGCDVFGDCSNLESVTFDGAYNVKSIDISWLSNSDTIVFARRGSDIERYASEWSSQFGYLFDSPIIQLSESEED